VSRQNVDLIRRHFDSWNAGDVDAVVTGLAPDVHWHGHPALPEPGPYHDREAVRRWIGQFQEAWDELNAEPVEVLDAGDSVVVLVHMTGRGRGSGVEVRGGVDVHVATFRDEEVVYFRLYQGDVAAGLAGLSDMEREALIARVQEGMSEPEIAAHLGVSAEEIGSILEATYAKLREIPKKDASRAAQPG
jgi:ketosteroid isomerase-like protein